MNEVKLDAPTMTRTVQIERKLYQIIRREKQRKGNSFKHLYNHFIRKGMEAERLIEPENGEKK